ncbi:uncharacterized protein LTR77_004829 [Saxophila tyrrhenica]|uniref:Uncharacterized protein n=1 Tax=Saxophila tyrrhenica TaxID=1690608 RepID=A0AAV9PEI6_9PEZI|nr:hypothetical protein LTR77_004829 [Saxophila tyrrhenica]
MFAVTQGKVSFLTASTVTDAAFGLLRCVDAEFSAVSSQHSTACRDIVHFFGLVWFTRENAIWLCPAEAKGNTDEPRKIDPSLNIVELLCPVAFLCLLSYNNDAGAVCTAASARKQEKKNVAELESSGLHHFYEFCCVLWKLAPQLHDIAHTQTCEHIVIDEFVQGLVDCHRNGKMPMWTIVVCQIYLDVYDLLGDHISHADIVALRDETGFSMSDAGDAMTTLEWVAKAFNRFEEATWIAPEGAHALPAKQHTRIREELGCSASAMERALPAHTGAILGDLKIGMHEAGTQLANHGYYVLSMAHLYKALRAQGKLDSDWQDMDFALAAFDTKQPLLPKPGQPYDGEAAVLHYVMSMGVPTQGASSKSFKKGLPLQVGLKDERKIAIKSALLSGLSDRQQAWKKSGLGYSKIKTLEVVLHSLTASASQAKDSPSAPRGSQVRVSFTPLQLLATYKKAFMADEPQLNFDYASFMVTCPRLLKTISNSSTISGDHFTLVSELLRSPTPIPAVAEATNIIKAHVANSGKLFIKQAYDQSSGRIPKAMRPNIELNLETREASLDMFSTMYEYSNTKYAFSGRAMAVYHPKVKPELCPEKSCKGHALREGAETDPHAHHHGERVMTHGSALPNAIMDEGLEAVKKNPAKIAAARSRTVNHYFKLYELGKITETKLRELVRNIMGLEIAPREKQGKDDKDPLWAYALTPESSMYMPWFQGLVLGGEATPAHFGVTIMVNVALVDFDAAIKDGLVKV